jgi:predicted dehydrogenase
MPTRLADICNCLLGAFWSAASHINELWEALAALYGTNGSVYLDSTRFSYKCSENGGWSDFFQTEEGWLTPWTEELAAEESCSQEISGHGSRHAQAIDMDYGLARYDPGIVRKVHTWKTPCGLARAARSVQEDVCMHACMPCHS